MKRSKSMEALGGRRWRFSHAILAAIAVYFVFISLKFCHFPESGSMRSGDRRFSGDSGGATGDVGRHFLGSIYHGDAFNRSHDPSQLPHNDPLALHASPLQPYRQRYGRITGEMLRRFERSQNQNQNRNRNRTRRGDFSELEKMAHEAWLLGLKAWEEVKSYKAGAQLNSTTVLEGKPKPCPSFVLMNGVEWGVGGERIMFLPCGLAVGSSITVIGTPQIAHEGRLGRRNGKVMVSQFVVELQGLKTVDGEDPPKILHLNPRLKGDYSKRPVIEHNTCYRMKWGKPMRCDGRPSEGSNETVDGFRSCEKWEHAETVNLEESKTTSWLNRFIGRAKKPEMAWPFPFVEDRMFVLTLQAGVEGYHINVGGRHVTSFPYRSGFTLQDATGLAIKENVDVHSVYATSLPESHPSFSLHDVLEMSEKWKTPSLPENPVELFIGVLSGTNHFAERMAIRKTWMQYPAVQSSNVVARFFVALGPRKDANAALKKESEYFGDIVILPFMDRYELLVLKTIAICEFGVHNLTAEYIMKSDDDTFTRVDVILNEIEDIAHNKSLFMGNLNFLHKPLRHGKWAVTYQEWPEEVYPTYANGPGYIISSDIAKYIASQHANQTLRLFKMEDVSMGMWVEEFNATTPVQYSHSWNFCQYGCVENYYTAHYQSPRQMMCLWENLSRGQPQCCGFR